MVSHFTLPVPPSFSISAVILQIPGAFPFFNLAMATAASARDGSSQLMSGSSSADAAALMRPSVGVAGGLFSNC